MDGLFEKMIVKIPVEGAFLKIFFPRERALRNHLE